MDGLLDNSMPADFQHASAHMFRWKDGSEDIAVWQPIRRWPGPCWLFVGDDVDRKPNWLKAMLAKGELVYLGRITLPTGATTLAV